MMTGKKDLRAYSTKEIKPTEALGFQSSAYGVPVFIDELDGSYLGHIKSYIKTPEAICENVQNDHIPMLIFASNDLTDPNMQLRKRMIFLNPEGTIPADTDQNAWASAGLAILNHLTNALYSEYCRRMIPKVWNMINQMETDGGRKLPEDWYPDALKPSSETIMEILREFGYKIPDYMRTLTWKEDFSESAAYIMDDALAEIKDLYKANRKSFQIKKDTVTIFLGSESRKTVNSWAAVLPQEIIRHTFFTKDGCSIIIERKELEKMLGFRLRKCLI